MKGLNPIWLTAAGLFLALQTNIATGNISLHNVLPELWVPWAIGWAKMIASYGVVASALLPQFSSAKTGFFVSNEQAISPAIKAAILVAVLFGVSAFVLPVHAQQNLLPKVHTGAKAAVAQPAAAVPDLITTIDQAIDKLDAIGPDVVTKVVADINAADADAATLTNPADPTSFKDAISHACYPAGVKFLQSLPVATPLTGAFQGIQLFQRKRDFIAQIQVGLPAYLKIGCGALLGDETKIFVTLLGMVGVTVASGGLGLFPATALSLPALVLPAL